MSDLILGLETSCDETAASVISSDAETLSSVVASQLSIHAKYGGVVPELASREHLRAIVPVVREALRQANVRGHDLSAIAVTEGPGLVGCLLIGISYAKTLSYALSKPLIAVNHVEGHIHAVLWEARQRGQVVEYPAIALVASGGHSHLFLVDQNLRYRLLGKTRDDAAGEAFDKVGKLLGYRYPGGPLVDALAAFGNPRAIRFTQATVSGNPMDLSFSGLKTAVLRWVQAHGMEREIATRQEMAGSGGHSLDEWKAATPAATLDLLASFQYTVVEMLTKRLVWAVEAHDGKAVIVTGGVAANRGLRDAAVKALPQVPVLFPSLGLATDNAAMIAAAALPKFQRGDFTDLTLGPKANLPLTTVE